MKGKEGEANGMKRSQIKWKLLLFDESDLFLFRPVYFLFSFNRAALFILSQIKKRDCITKKKKKNKKKKKKKKKTHTHTKKKQIIRWSGLKRTYNLLIVKKHCLDRTTDHTFLETDHTCVGIKHKLCRKVTTDCSLIIPIFVNGFDHNTKIQ